MNVEPVVIDTEEFKTEMRKTVKGQEEAVNYLAFIARMYSMQMIAETFEYFGDSEVQFPKNTLMLTGTTGSGKTFLIKSFKNTMSKLLQAELPYTKLDCSQVTADGYVGTSVSDVVREHLAKTKTGFGILHLDEFDKILPSNGGADDFHFNSNFTAGKMNAFLELLDGDFSAAASSNGRSLQGGDCSAINRTLIICTGSFQQARDKEEKFTSNPIGFINGEHVDVEVEEKPENWKEKMGRLGYLKEISGRICHAVEIQPYSKDEILEILVRGQNSAYRQYLNILGTQNALEHEELERIAQEAEESEAGLRILNSLLFEAFYRQGGWK